MGGVSRASEKEKEEEEEETSSSSRTRVLLAKIVKRNAQLEKKMSEIFKILSDSKREENEPTTRKTIQTIQTSLSRWSF
jgi:hypothetical protein